MNRMLKCAALVLALLMLPWGGLAEAAETWEGLHTVECRTYPYLRSFGDEEETVESEMNLYFVDGGDIPYAALSEYMPFFAALMRDYDAWEGMQFEIERTVEEDGVTDAYFVHRRDNGTMMIIMPQSSYIMIDSYNLFTAKPGVTSLVAALELPEPEKLDLGAILDRFDEMMAEMEDKGEEIPEDVFEQYFAQYDAAKNRTFFLNNGNSFNRHGSGSYLDLADYGIKVYSVDGECYLPFQTMNDLFMNRNYFQFIFNGREVLGAAYGCQLLERAFEAEPEEMSGELKAFNYSELLFLLDTFYGLKPEHGIDSFRDMLSHNLVLLNGLQNGSAAEFDDAIAQLMGVYLDDLHSSYLRCSWRNPNNDMMEDFVRFYNSMGYSTAKSLKDDTRFNTAREKIYPDGVPGYEEIGDTAFVTFDSFHVDVDDYPEYYGLGIPGSLEDCGDDTIRLIQYANTQIQREDSPIKNVVIDLSNNGGGNVAAAVAVMCWYLDIASFALRDTMTDALSIMNYDCDLNLNEVSREDDGDNLVGRYRLYCLVSPVSFSCGNLVPAFFKDSHQVTLIGQRTGGGSCVVLPCSTASGTLFQISGTQQIALVKNGTFYNVDEGIDPDIVLTQAESFYDREGLVELIHATR